MNKSTYRSYLLRMWRDNALAPWRASLQPPGHAEPLAFADLEKLFTFLCAETGQAAPHPTGLAGSEGDAATDNQ